MPLPASLLPHACSPTLPSLWLPGMHDVKVAMTVAFKPGTHATRYQLMLQGGICRGLRVPPHQGSTSSLRHEHACMQGPDVIQTPTCSHVVEAEADIAGESPVTSGSRHSSSGGLSNGNGLVSKLARRLTTRRSFHGSYDDFDSIRGGAGRGGTQSVTFQGMQLCSALHVLIEWAISSCGE